MALGWTRVLLAAASFAATGPCSENQVLDRTVFDFFFQAQGSRRLLGMIFEPGTCEEWFDERAGKPAAIRTYRGDKGHDLVLVMHSGSTRTETIAVVWVNGSDRRVAGYFREQEITDLTTRVVDAEGYLLDHSVPAGPGGPPGRSGTATFKPRPAR